MQKVISWIVRSDNKYNKSMMTRYLYLIIVLFIHLSVDAKKNVKDQFGCVGKDGQLIAYRIISASSVEVSQRDFYVNYKSISIPEIVKYKGKVYSVTSIGDYAFSSCTKLSEVQLPNTITSIMSYAFRNCESIKSVQLPNSVLSIGIGAFQGCKLLTEFTIPVSITTIGYHAFADCTSLKRVFGLKANIKDGQELFVGCPFSYEEYCNGIVDNRIELAQRAESANSLFNQQKKQISEKTSNSNTEFKTKNNQLSDIDDIIPLETADNEDLTRRERKIFKAAQNGDTESQIWLGNFYLGRGKEGDQQLAAKWYKQAADHGSHRAQYFLGYCYEKGIGVVKDTILAKKCYEKAAEKNKEAAVALNKLQVKSFETSEKGTAVKPIDGSSSSNDVVENSKPSGVSQISHSSPNKNETPDVEMNVPSLSQTNINTFAIIIANEDYQREAKVDFAMNDGRVFKMYCHKILGIPDNNVHLLTNATLNNMIYELDWLEKVCKAYKGEASVIFYYAGHGLPDESNRKTYLLPTDGVGSHLRTCFSTDELYSILGNLSAKRVAVFMDACFSGAKRNGQMIDSARGVAIKAKTSAPKGKMMLMTAAQGDETAYAYQEKSHGLFTYFLLKKLKETKGNVTFGELGSYIIDEVSKMSIVVNGKSQTPTVSASALLGNNWKTLKLK